ncbi:MAG: tRNA 5-methoxyuridine(34)/uridine 5-oxyacetic acid(34) synthase CmoB [Planctomycetota bacterium]
MPRLFDWEPLFRRLQRGGHGSWAETLRQLSTAATASLANGHLPAWRAAWDQLPACEDVQLIADQDAVTLTGQLHPDDCRRLPELLRVLHPWRKGPFQFFGTRIDTEWRSCLKWDRLAPHVSFRGCRVLDVGCGNGYYGWRMLQSGADLVLGLDPFLLYVMQFEFLRRYLPEETPHYILPLGDSVLPHGLHAFDLCLSMGVLYHRTSPIDHLQSLWQTLAPGGRLVLETLVLPESDSQVLVPSGRYAKMRNVWMIPTIPLLLTWLRRCGFDQLRILDVTATTVAEQRRTAWMTFKSLADFLDPDDPTLTIEGYPAPLRALVTASRG